MGVSGVGADTIFVDPATGQLIDENACKERAHVLRTTDEYGRRLTESYFDVSGKRALFPGALFHLVKFAYDDLGRESAVTFFGVGGEPVLNASGFHRCEREFNSQGEEAN
jgi:hypothetical protein